MKESSAIMYDRPIVMTKSGESRKEKSWEYIIAVIIVEIVLTLGLPVIPAYVVWKNLIIATSARFIISFSVYAVFFLIIVKVKNASSDS